MTKTIEVAALYVETRGAYFDLDEVMPWDIERDARQYSGPHPVVAHPPCQRWGRYWHGAPRKPHQYRLGEDGGCFAAALTAVRNYGGVLEHPKDSLAWKYFGLTHPPAAGGWVKADAFGGWTCCVWQGHFGHFAGKGTWLYAVVDAPDQLPELIWGPSDSGPTMQMIERYGYEKARRVGRMALVGGKDKTRIRNATPLQFRSVLLAIARNARSTKQQMPCTPHSSAFKSLPKMETLA
ncbi:hypothetical protein [Delftia sp. DT-2]|uniref:hypothetical protein n=1 Tax=Delftia sp. DT-2 TaxID=3022772 RepID=UPI00233EBE6B|nr:hypothetical protein [Delftia sp. DT-2]MDC2857303.1 hypothetical protein [Delftia sp. DT-2]